MSDGSIHLPAKDKLRERLMAQGLSGLLDTFPSLLEMAGQSFVGHSALEREVRAAFDCGPDTSDSTRMVVDTLLVPEVMEGLTSCVGKIQGRMPR